MVDAIGAKPIKKLPLDELKKLSPAQVKEKEKEGQEVPKEVKEMTGAMAASASAPDAVSYETKTGDAAAGQDAETGNAGQMQANVAAVAEADAVINQGIGVQNTDKPKQEAKDSEEQLSNKDKAITERPPVEEEAAQPGAIKAPDENVGAVKPEEPAQENRPPEAFEAPRPQAAPPPEEEKKNNPVPDDTQLSTDPNEILKRKERKGIQQ
ncbi:MAG: hypothetical protein LBK53_07475 [Heliobacteriaceae bacterium]|jgi:hypothetical protein|nr:hypothetical protein [Heliobacteriaceae bacterium]